MARAAPQREDRRGAISRALYHCISEQGYASTSLKDIADRAGMSPSHVGYYFDNKAAILEYYADSICEHNLAALPNLGEPNLDRLVDDLANFCLGEGQMNTALLGVIQELTGLAVHDDRLHEIKARHSTALREYLERFFERAKPADGISPREAAWVAHSILVGLNTNTLFDAELSRERAHETLRRAFRTLIGLDEFGQARARVTRGPRPARGRSKRSKR